MTKLTYEQSGDNYLIKDPFKLQALAAAKTTAANSQRFKQYGLTINEVPDSRGESAYRLEITAQNQSFQLAHVEEGLGTKNVIADELAEIYGPTAYRAMAIDNAASIFNDLATTGAAPLSFMLHLAAYPTEWFTNLARNQALLEGTAEACNLAGAVWGGGESATLRDIIQSGRSLLSGSATGIIIPSHQALSETKLAEGDVIIGLASTGVHTNGITLLRQELLSQLPDGYSTQLADGTTYGQALLTPSAIYASLVESLIHSTKVHYAVCISGHGWRKIMRAQANWSYDISYLPPVQPVFDLIQNYSQVDDQEMYASYNMGVGFVLFAPVTSIDKIMELANQHHHTAYQLGSISHGPKQIRLKPKEIIFQADSLAIR